MLVYDCTGFLSAPEPRSLPPLIFDVDALPVFGFTAGVSDPSPSPSSASYNQLLYYP
jgi:hypothetical protein